MRKFDSVIAIINKVKNDKIFVYSSHASFFILISAIPFITLSFSLMTIFFPINEKNVYDILLPFFPRAVQDTAEDVFSEIFVKASNGFISFSILSLLWTASRGISAIKRGVKRIFNLPMQPFFKDALLSILQMLFMIFLMTLFMIFAFLPTIFPHKTFIFIIGFSVFLCFFSVIYYLLAGRSIPFKTHLIGSISASLCWIVFLRIFSFYIEHFANYSHLYGNLTTAFLIALWIYFSIIIFFFGAELNSILFFEKQKKNC